MLEDMRIENYMVRIYPKCEKYLLYINTVIINEILEKMKNDALHDLIVADWRKNLWLAQIGKVYLPKRFRLKLIEKTNTFDDDTTNRLISLVNEYINLACKYGKKLKHKKYRDEYITKSLLITKDMYEIIKSKNAKVISPPHNDAVKDLKEDIDKRILDVADTDFNDIDENDIGRILSTGISEDRESEEIEEKEIEERSIEGEGVSSEEEGGESIADAEAEAEAVSEEGNEDTSSGIGERKEGEEEDSNEKIIEEIERIKKEVKKIIEDTKESVIDEVLQDYRVIMEIDTELLTPEERRIKERIDKILEKIINEYKPHWILRQKEGRINLKHAMKGEANGDTRIFKKFKAGKMNEISFLIFLNVDTSGSMCGERIEAVRSIARVILKSFEKTESKLKVVSFSDYPQLHKDWEDKFIPYLDTWGFTKASPTLRLILDEVRELKKKYRKPILLITITDGDWDDKHVADELIKEIKKLGVITVEINIEVSQHHGSEFHYKIDDITEFPEVIKDLTEKIARRLIKQRRYIA